MGTSGMSGMSHSVVPERNLADGIFQHSEAMCVLGSYPQAGLHCGPGEISGPGCAQEVLLSDQTGTNELPLHSHGPFALYNPGQVSLDPQLGSPKGRWG